MDAGRYFSLAAMTPLRPKKIEKACKICGSRARIFDVVDFFKFCGDEPYQFGISGVPVYYFRCDFCDFTFTDFCDTWNHEDFSGVIYNSDYLAVDPDYVELRPKHMAYSINNILIKD